MRRIQWGRILLDVPVPKADWLVGLWRRTADVFMQDAGDQALIGQTFLNGSPLQHFKVGGTTGLGGPPPAGAKPLAFQKTMGRESARCGLPSSTLHTS
jgi:hypothetical protein